MWRFIVSLAVCCAAILIAQSSRAVEIPRPTINIPRPNIPRPSIHVPRPNIPRAGVNIPRAHISAPRRINEPKVRTTTGKGTAPASHEYKRELGNSAKSKTLSRAKDEVQKKGIGNSVNGGSDNQKGNNVQKNTKLSAKTENDGTNGASAACPAGQSCQCQGASCQWGPTNGAGVSSGPGSGSVDCSGGGGVCYLGFDYSGSTPPPFPTKLGTLTATASPASCGPGCTNIIYTYQQGSGSGTPAAPNVPGQPAPPVTPVSNPSNPGVPAPSPTPTWGFLNPSQPSANAGVWSLGNTIPFTPNVPVMGNADQDSSGNPNTYSENTIQQADNSDEPPQQADNSDEPPQQVDNPDAADQQADNPDAADRPADNPDDVTQSGQSDDTTQQAAEIPDDQQVGIPVANNSDASSTTVPANAPIEPAPAQSPPPALPPTPTETEANMGLVIPVLIVIAAGLLAYHIHTHPDSVLSNSVLGKWIQQNYPTNPNQPGTGAPQYYPTFP